MIYVHVPFCHRKCTYCAFFSRPESGKWKVESYVDVLLQEMELRRGEQAHPIRTVYFGGGTPSMLPIGHLARIVEGLRRCFDLSQVEEVTLEANPEDLTPDYLAALASLGLFNRLSIGIQSLDDDVLRWLNRRHTSRQAIDAVERAHEAGFHNISVDFIYGVVSASPMGPISPIGPISLISPIVSMVNHISVYSLTVEAGTALARQVEQGRVALPDEDEVVRQYFALHDLLEREGLHQYEVSNYARPGFESRHNSRYWDRTPYLGLGPGAHSFDGQCRHWNNPDGTVGEELLTPADAYNELLMTSLRTVRGLPLEAVPEGQKERLHRAMQPYVDCGWIERSDRFYRPTPEGLLHADGMAAALFIA